MTTETSLKQRSDFSDLEGQTIRSVIESPCGTGAGNIRAVLVFDDNSWCAITAETDDDHAYAYLSNHDDITIICTPKELVDSGLINSSQAAILEERNLKRDSEMKQRKIAYMKTQLAKLESA